MPDRNYQKLKHLEDGRKLANLEAIHEIEEQSGFNIADFIPGTVPEKMVYQHLVRLRVRFQFQYHATENFMTYYPESNWQPDFILPDYHDTIIEVYGTYWHTLSRNKDQLKKAYWLMQGYAIVEQGVVTYPTGNWRGGKVVIWWDYEIYHNLGALFARDLPEVLTNRIKGTADPLLIDAEKQFKKMEAQVARMSEARRFPKYKPRTSSVRKLRKRIYGQTPTGIKKRGRARQESKRPGQA